MRLIRLSNGSSAMVDDEDFEMLSHWSWQECLGGYAKRGQCKRGYLQTVSMHRTLMLPDPDGEVDHINGDRLDNRRCNLRLCTKSQNQHNKSASRISASRYKGVSPSTGGTGWKAFIWRNGRNSYLGTFPTEGRAARAYDAAAAQAFGSFAKLNLGAGQCA